MRVFRRRIDGRLAQAAMVLWLTCMLIVGNAPLAAADGGDTAVITAAVAICDHPERGGTVTYLVDPVQGIDFTGCRPARMGEVTVDLYESATAAEDRGIFVASASTNVNGDVSFSAPISLPYVYLGQGRPGAGGQFSTDIAVATARQVSFFVLNHTGASDPGGALMVPTSDSAVVDVSSFVCTDASRVGTAVVGIDDPLKQDLDLAACRPAHAGEFAIKLLETPDTETSADQRVVATDEPDATGATMFRYDLDRPFIAVSMGSTIAAPVSATGGQRLSYYTVSYVPGTIASNSFVINAQRIECPDTDRIGSVDVVDGGSATDPVYAACLPSGNADATISLYAAAGAVEDRPKMVTTVSTTDGGYVGFTYTGDQPFVFLRDNGVISSAIQAVPGGALNVLIVAYV